MVDDPPADPPAIVWPASPSSAPPPTPSASPTPSPAPTPTPTPSPVEAEVDAVLDCVAVLDPDALVDDALVQRLIYDVAARIHPPETIAERYGLGSGEKLLGYLRGHPGVREAVKKTRAMLESDKATEERLKLKFQYAVESLIPALHNLSMSPATPVGARVDAFRQLQRGAGMDGVAAVQRAGAQPSGSAFQLVINFPGGEKTEITATPVIDADVAAPPLLLPDDE